MKTYTREEVIKKIKALTRVESAECHDGNIGYFASDKGPCVMFEDLLDAFNIIWHCPECNVVLDKNGDCPANCDNDY